MILIMESGKVSAVAMVPTMTLLGPMCHALTCLETVSVRGRLHLINTKVTVKFPLNENSIVGFNSSLKRSTCLGIVLLIGNPSVVVKPELVAVTDE